MSVVERSFSVHPSVIKSIILEQAGDPCKALVELVMNSIDAGATEIHLNVSSTHFSIRDDGRGFESKQEVLDYFGTFGTPHAQDDATYGVFRIGRGQAFALAKTEWRSGRVGMLVNLNGLENRSDIGYQLTEHEAVYKGCEIKGEFFDPLHTLQGHLNAKHFNDQLNTTLTNFAKLRGENGSQLQRLLSGMLPKEMSSGFFARLFTLLLMVDVPVHLNGILITQAIKPNLVLSDHLFDIYLFDRRSTSTGVLLLNQGVLITKQAFPVPCIINFKEKPSLNMARNSISKDCPLYREAITQLYRFCFKSMIDGDKRMKDYKDSILSGLGSRSFVSVANLLNMLNIPHDVEIDEFEKFLDLVPVNMLYGEPMDLLELVTMLKDSDNWDELSQDFCQASFGYVSNRGRDVAAEYQKTQDETKRVIYAVQNMHLDNCLFSNLQDIYNHFFYYALPKGGVEFETKIKRIPFINYLENNSDLNNDLVFKLENNVIKLGTFTEISARKLKNNQNLINFLTELVAEFKQQLLSFYPELDLKRNHPLYQGEEIEVRFLEHFDRRCESPGFTSLVAHAYLDHRHFIIFNHALLSDYLKNYFRNYRNFSNSIFSQVFLALLRTGFDENIPLHELHGLRKHTEDLLFKVNFKEIIQSFDKRLAIFVQEGSNTKKMTASAIKSRQTQMKMYKNIVDQLGGFSREFDQTLSEFLAVES